MSTKRKKMLDQISDQELQLNIAAWAAFPDETEDMETGEHVDDYGYPAEARKGFKVGYRAAMLRFRAQNERAWRDGYYTGKRDYAGSIMAGEWIATPNPYSVVAGQDQ